MQLSTVIYVTVIFFVVLIFVLFPGARALFGGFARLFIKDMATTPEGAAAIYEEKINDAQDKYNKADDALRIASGRLDNEQKKLKTLQTNLQNAEKACESLVSAGKMDLASVKAEERSEILSDIERTKKLIEVYTQARHDAMDVHKACEINLRKLKRESREVVENMKVKAQLNEVYDSMDELKNSTATDRLLDSIKEKNEDLNASVAGARVVHENKLSTKIGKANEAAAKATGDEYLESLKKKYNK